MHPLIQFFIRANEQINHFKQEAEAEGDEDEDDNTEHIFEMPSWGQINSRRYYLMRDGGGGVSRYFIGFNKEEYIDVFVTENDEQFVFDSGFNSFVHEKDEDQLLIRLIEFIIFDGAIQKRSGIKGRFQDYDDAPGIHRILVAILETLKFIVIDLNPGFRVEKNLKLAATPLEKSFRKLGIGELNGEKIHFGKLSNNSYYFIGVNIESGIYRYELRALCGTIIVKVNPDEGRELKKIAIEISCIQAKKQDVFQKILESICFDCTHGFIPGDWRTMECTLETTKLEQVKPGFHFFKATHVNQGNSQYFTFDL
jgi:hypothetical protein